MDREREDWRFVAAAGALGFAIAYLAMCPRWLALVNWDNGSFLAEMASGRGNWSSPVWNAHFAAKHVYFLGAFAVRPFGGTFLDGFRLADALFFAANTAVIASATRRLTGERLLAALLTSAWATSWVMIFLLLTLEDNILFLAPAAGVLWLCALRADRWSARESAWAGAWAALACLMSWQAILYLAPAFYCACIGGPRRARTLGRRARDAGVLFASFAATLVAWCVFIWLTSSLTMKYLLGDMFSRPTGSFETRSLADVGGQLKALGVAMSYFLAHTAYDPPSLPLGPIALGALAWLAILGALAGGSWWAWRLRRWPLHVLAASTALFAFVTPLYKDVEYRYLIRYDFLPPLAVLLLACAAGELEQRRWWPRARAIAAALLALIVVGQSALAARWDRARLASYPSLASWAGAHPRGAWYGRDGKSWYAFFRGVRVGAPSACRHVLALDEITDGRWNLDIMGALWSELPKHEVVALPADVAKWRFPPRVVAPADAARYLADGCSWLSADARRVLARP